MLLSGAAGSQGTQAMTKAAEPILQAKWLAAGGNTSAHSMAGVKEKAQALLFQRERDGVRSPILTGFGLYPAPISQGLSMCPLLAAAGMGLPSPTCSSAGGWWYAARPSLSPQS